MEGRGFFSLGGALNFKHFFTRDSLSENVDRVGARLLPRGQAELYQRDHLHKPCLLRSSEEGTLDGYVITEFSMLSFM